MGNSSTKEARASSSRPDSLRPSGSPSRADGSTPSEPRHDRPSLNHASRSSRNNRHDLSLFGLGGGADRELPSGETRKETKQEREARKAEKERVLRAKERERSLQEEGVDGGFLVTLGTYTGPEDFSKLVVRQLMIERRIAPFWRGLNDHAESWTQHQLVAVARGLELPAPDAIPAEDTVPSTITVQSVPVSRSAVPTSSNVMQPFSNTNKAMNLSSSQPVPYGLGTSSPSTPSAPSSLFRGRSKTLASITSMRNTASTEVQPQEMQLPQDPYVNGQPIEAVLYKDAAECPICFLYYPPYLNRTRCCDQTICSECFVQIKRPDPHPPEHADPSIPLPEPKPLAEAEQLVSESAMCPFCKQSEFGVSYEAPAFRRGLTYAAQTRTQLSAKASSPISSSASLLPLTNNDLSSSASAFPSRRRAQSLSASATTVITTDKVRPDWAKKLSDARAHAARRAAAATALHTAAFMMGGAPGAGPSIGRRRRGLLGMDSPIGLSRSGSTPHLSEGAAIPNMDVLLAALEASGANRLRSNGDLIPGRGSSRQNRAQDLEDIMMMEAIRLSLAAEEERQKKEDKEAAKEAKKEDKKKLKEQKKTDKPAKKGLFHSPNPSHEGVFPSSPEHSTLLGSLSNAEGKGKAKAVGLYGTSPVAARTGLYPSTESLTQGGDSQRHLEQSRAALDSSRLGASPGRSTSDLTSQSRFFSTASSTDSSFVDSPVGSLRPGFDPTAFEPTSSGNGTHAYSTRQEIAAAAGTPGTEQAFNYGSLTAMLGKERVQNTEQRESRHTEPASEERYATNSAYLKRTISPHDSAAGEDPKST